MRCIPTPYSLLPTAINPKGEVPHPIEKCYIAFFQRGQRAMSLIQHTL
ncbi:MAG: hypothetical protein F6J90_13410 [Moorea sp. SIOASIH]|nr:hypothetical protein [Moorena sp. SIOASIH]NEO37264.1 hypothetical protein [Moorena sp. SIOASIH]